MNIKACLLAAGEGKRLAPITETRPKHMIPLGGKPLLQHTLEMLRDNKITEILLIVGYLKEKIQDYFGDGSKFGLKITYVEQKEFLGTAHATGLAQNFMRNDPFLLIYGDLLMDQEVFQKSIATFTSGQCNATIAALTVPDPTKFGIIKSNSEGFMETIVEKPVDDRYGKLANAGVYLLPSDIFKCIATTKKSIRGEFELTDSIQMLIDQGKKMKVVDISMHYWSDVGHPWQLLDANNYIMSALGDQNKIINNGGIIEEFVHIKGPVVIGKGTVIKSGTYIEGPAFIGENCEIGPHAYIRPFASIGNKCHIGNSSEVKASILLDHVFAAHLSYIGDSIIGEGVNIGCGAITANVRLDKKPISMEIKDKKVATGLKKLGAVIGDFASLGIQVSVMPGKTIGSYSQIGSNTLVQKNIPPNSLVYIKQELEIKELRK